MPHLNKRVFYPPFLLLLVTIVYSLIDYEGFLSGVKFINEFILTHFSGVFAWSALGFLILVLVIYCAPVSGTIIGGKDAVPLLSKWKWFSITLCTTIATGILFWGAAEPIFHLNEPPANLGLLPHSVEAKDFAMSTLFMHWTFIPYAIYTLAGLVFALSFYNLRQPFRLGSMLYPVIGDRAHGHVGTIIDIVCLYALVAGMSASLGSGILSIMGGLEHLLGWQKTNVLLVLIALSIVLAFVLSSISGLKKGISLLSDINIRGFLLLALFVFLAGPTLSLLDLGYLGGMDFVRNFIPRSLNWRGALNDSWFESWTVFYWANWFAWVPITALFLGRLAYGYTVRQFIHFNLIIPSLFGGFWMVIFGGIAIYMDIDSAGELYASLQSDGAESVFYMIMSNLPIEHISSTLFLILIFISYVTAADSNTSAMSALSSNGISPTNQEAPVLVKIIWGAFIGMIAYIMISSIGLDGVKMISVLGGFPVLFFMLIVAASAIRLIFRKNYL